MATNSKTKDDDLTVQEHCIDLPGESVQCWIGGRTDKLKVILRKHRDVIFDIALGNGKTYALGTTESDFYNVRDKKLVMAAQQGQVTFNDGEKMHIWVSRDFRGALVLKSGDQILYKVEPNELDSHPYSDDPQEKPAPIVVAIGKNSAPATAPNKLSPPNHRTKLSVPRPVVAASAVTTSPHGLDCPVVCVIDGNVEGMPVDIARHFAKGGDHSAFSDIDPNHVATRNWIWGQVSGAGAYVKDNWSWLHASLDGQTSKGFQLVKVQVHKVREKVRFYFSGYSNSNTIFGRGGFGPGHDRIMTIFSGVGKTKSVFGATLRGVAGAFEKCAWVSFIFGAATAYAEWKDDIHKDGYDLAAVLITTAIKTILAAVLISIAVAAIVFIAMFFFAASTPVILIGAATITGGFLANYLVEAVDKSIGRATTGDPSNTDGTASIIAAWSRKSSEALQERAYQNWRYLMSRMSHDFQETKF